MNASPYVIPDVATDNTNRCPLQPASPYFETPTEVADPRYSLHPDPLTETSSFPNLGALASSLQSVEQQHGRLIPHVPQIPRAVPIESPFLALAGEIRNRIYRYVLVSSQPFAVQLQFAPLDTALLRVNKQIHAEASSIFYHENAFRFPQALFVGAEILPQLEKLYRISPTRLRTMRNFVLDVPVSTFTKLSESRPFHTKAASDLRTSIGSTPQGSKQLQPTTTDGISDAREQLRASDRNADAMRMGRRHSQTRFRRAFPGVGPRYMAARKGEGGLCMGDSPPEAFGSLG